MRLTRRRLNRTLLLRQHLLERTGASAYDLVEHLVGLQAQDNLPPYLGLAARLASFDPYVVSAGLEDRTLVRTLTMRGTIHLHTAADAVLLRPWTQARIEQVIRQGPPNGLPPGVDRPEFEVVLDEVLSGPLPVKELGVRLAARFPAGRPADLAQAARNLRPLAQLPPRGCWGASGGVVYDTLERWTGLPLVADPDVPGLVRRCLRAFGPASATDVSAWSGVTRLGPVLAGMADLVRHEDEAGRPLFDLADGVLADEGAHAPVRLLGTYDNLWLAHHARDRVMEPEHRKAWMGANGGAGHVLLADGWLAGLWRVTDGRVEVVELLRPLTPDERAGLDEESARVEALLAR